MMLHVLIPLLVASDISVPVDLAWQCKTHEAIAAIAALSPAEKDDPEIELLLANLLINSGKPRKALPILKTLLERDTVMPGKAALAMGYAYSAIRNVPLARHFFSVARKKGELPEIVDCALGTMWAENGRMELAEQYLRKALSIDPRLAGALYNLGVVHAAKKNEAEAAALIYMAWVNGMRDLHEIKHERRLGGIIRRGLIQDIVSMPESKASCMIEY